MVLEPLNHDQSIQLARALLGDELHDNSSVEHIADESRGNPFFLRELTNYAESERREGKIPLRGKLSLDELLWGRIVALPADLRLLLEVIAVAGAPISVDFAIRAADIERLDASVLADSQATDWFAHSKLVPRDMRHVPRSSPRDIPSSVATTEDAGAPPETRLDPGTGLPSRETRTR